MSSEKVKGELIEGLSEVIKDERISEEIREMAGHLHDAVKQGANRLLNIGTDAKTRELAAAVQSKGVPAGVARSALGLPGDEVPGPVNYSGTASTFPTRVGPLADENITSVDAVTPSEVGSTTYKGVELSEAMAPSSSPAAPAAPAAPSDLSTAVNQGKPNWPARMILPATAAAFGAGTLTSSTDGTPTPPSAPQDKAPEGVATKDSEEVKAKEKDKSEPPPPPKSIDDYIQEAKDRIGAGVGSQKYEANVEGINEAIKQHSSLLNDPSIKDKVTESDRKEFKADLRHYEELMHEGRKTLGYAETAEIIGQALAQIGGALYGLKEGVDASGAKFTRTDWSKRRQEIMDDAKRAYDIRLEEFKMLERESERGSAKKERSAQAIRDLGIKKSEAVTAAKHKTLQSKEDADRVNAKMRESILSSAIAMKGQDDKAAAEKKEIALRERINKLEIDGKSVIAEKETLDRLEKERKAKEQKIVSGRAKLSQAMYLDQTTDKAQSLIKEGVEELSAAGYTDPFSLYTKAREAAESGWDNPERGVDVVGEGTGLIKYEATSPDGTYTETRRLTEKQAQDLLSKNWKLTKAGD